VEGSFFPFFFNCIPLVLVSSPVSGDPCWDAILFSLALLFPFPKFWICFSYSLPSLVLPRPLMSEVLFSGGIQPSPKAATRAREPVPPRVFPSPLAISPSAFLDPVCVTLCPWSFVCFYPGHLRNNWGFYIGVAAFTQAR